MRYMLLIYAQEQVCSEEKKAQCYAESTKLCHELQSKGKFEAALPLQPTATATSVQIREGRRIIKDGPFAETREQLGGFFLVQAKDIDEAIAIASRIPGARWGTVEIRPIVELTSPPEVSLTAAHAMN
jgi:hypothetical protein